MRYVEKVRGLKSCNWRLNPLLNEKYLYDLVVNDAVICRIGGVQINGFAETDGLMQKWRAHGSVDNCTGSMESSGILPIERECAVQRRIAIANGVAKVTVDIKGTPIRNFELDELLISGNWHKMELFDGESVKDFNLDFGGEFTFALPLAALKFSAEDGRSFELGTGGDFWRFAAIEGLTGFKAELCVTVTAEGIRINRKLIMLPDEAESIANRPWRFSWYFAWNIAGEISKLEEPLRQISINSIKLPESAMASDAGGEIGTAPCLTSGATLRVLKKIIRSSGENLMLTDLESNFCYNAAHIERPRKKALVHWDLLDYFELMIWASRQMGRSGKDFALRFKPNSPQQQLLLTANIQKKLSPTIEVGEFDAE